MLCPPIDSIFYPKAHAHEEAPLVGVIFSAVSTSINELSWNKHFYKNNKKIIRTICDFATRWFRNLPGSLTPINGPTSIAIISRAYMSLRKPWTPRFTRDIIDRSITYMYPVGRPSCFRGNPNINVLSTLIINKKMMYVYTPNQFRILWYLPARHGTVVW